MTEIRPPTYITIGRVARILGWNHHKARRWLAAAGVLVKRGNKLVTTPDRLRDAFPEVWDEILAEKEDWEWGG